MMPEDLTHMVLWWGPGVLLLMTFTYGFMQLARFWIGRTMDTKRQQMESAFGMAEQYVKQFLNAQRAQADALSRLATSVERSDSRDSLEHQQILVALRAMHRDLERLLRQPVEPFGNASQKENSDAGHYRNPNPQE
jgi:hypothetical protein